jgi:hypothetical protein
VGRISFINPAALGVAIDRAGQGGFEAAQMRAAFVGVDVVGETLDRLVVAVVVLQRHFDDEIGLRVFLLEINHHRAASSWRRSCSGRIRSGPDRI